jgi:transposase
MGRSRGGLTTKIHALVDAEGRPVRITLTAGQAGDAPVAPGLLEVLAPGATLIADRAYDTDAIRGLAAERGAWANIPQRVIRKDSFAFSGWVYRQRNCIERFFNRLKHFRGLATRYDRRPENSSPPSARRDAHLAGNDMCPRPSSGVVADRAGAHAR